MIPRGDAQYRSGIHTTSDDQAEAANASKERHQEALRKAGHRGAITAEILSDPEVYYAEDYHQQYLAKNPRGYCGGGGGTGVACPIGIQGVPAE
ncbi:peptide-methionine (S)-S-oxide reductase [Jiella sp. KSK16Y-1]|uniref:peptide-methionine (S)-S-oxide reductase n=1 Tax=Jiella mangrovi TaxID=2821407 RepID=A0ABS4BL68_9HYPH|nr:peptide-methionine (S)-S-oxide reductase [Jiella mangrovi]